MARGNMLSSSPPEPSDGSQPTFTDDWSSISSGDYVRPREEVQRTSTENPGQSQTGQKSSSNEAVQPIAICGMSMRLPGGIRDAKSFWDLLYHGRSGQSRVPSNRYNVDAWYGPGKPGHVNSKLGYFIDHDLTSADSSFWSMTKTEMEIMDPQQRLALEIVYECLQSAGQVPKELKGKRIGIFMGTFEGDWLELDGRDTQSSHAYRLPGYGDYMSGNRIHYEFGFTGPSVTVRTACSASLTALHYACHALYTNECEAAVVSGINLIFSPRTTSTMQEQGVMSPTGSCKSFDASADGYTRAEAASAVYVKRLSDAIRDGDPIRAVIRSTTINSGGRAPSLTSPNMDAHESLIRQGHRLAGIEDFSKTAMIECHGTGTKVGDPIETGAVARVFGQYGIYIGSVKPNLGHSEGASGLSSLIKMVLALEHRIIPPNILFNSPNPQIPFEKAKLVVPTEPMPWPADRLERVGVNSFGIGGSNAHVLLESAASFGLRPAISNTIDAVVEKQGGNSKRLLIFSAKHPKSLARTVEDHNSYLTANPHLLDDTAFSLAVKRDKFLHRQFCIASDKKIGEPSRMSKLGATQVEPEIIFVFTGQGAQWPQMGQELLESYLCFQESFQTMEDVLASLEQPPSWKLRVEISKMAASSRISEAEISQPCCTAIQIALVDLLKHWDINAKAVVGHSSGEIAAAYAADAITLADAIKIAYYRGLSVQKTPQAVVGGMAVVALGKTEASKFLRLGVVIGCENSPESVTLSGDKVILEEVLDDIRANHPQIFVRLLHVDKAYHSHHMKHVAEKYKEMLGDLEKPSKPIIPFYSSVKACEVQDAHVLDHRYWTENLVSPVRFHSVIDAIIQERKAQRIFLEIGPHSALAGPLRQISRDNGTTRKDHYVSTLIRGQDAEESLLDTAGELWLCGIQIDFIAVNGKGKFLVDLPLYPWHYEAPLWAESRLSSEWRFRKHPHHDVLGSRVLETTDSSAIWRNILRLDAVSWIKQHEVSGSILFPGVGYIGMVAEALKQITDSRDVTLQHVNIKTGLVLHEGQDIEIITELRKQNLTDTDESEWWDFSISSLPGPGWVKHCFGQARAGSSLCSEVAPVITRQPRAVPSRTWYRAMKKFGFDYGPRFLCMNDLSAHPKKKIAVATIQEEIQDGESPWIIHPAALDAVLQIYSVAAYHGQPREFTYASVPTYITEISLRPSSGPITLQAVADEIPVRGSISGKLVGVSGGETIIRMKGVSLTRISESDGVTEDDPHAAVELEWKPDINLADPFSLLKINPFNPTLECILNEFTLASLLEIQDQIAQFQAETEYLRNYKSWLHAEAARIKIGHYNHVLSTDKLRDMSSIARLDLIEHHYEALHSTVLQPTAELMLRILRNIVSFFQGDAIPLEILSADGLLNQIHDFQAQADCSKFLELIAHDKPNMRILEIGARTQRFTQTILPCLKSAYGERTYFSYTYTSVFSSVLEEASDKFKSYEGIEYAILDISKDVERQGFQLGSFDLIVASNAIHATPFLGQALANIRKLLHPKGWIFVKEMDPATPWVDLVMGTLPGWWVGFEDQRCEQPYVDRQRWQTELEKAGFDRITIKHDNIMNNNIIACANRSKLEMGITLLHNDQQMQDIKKITDLLDAAGYVVHLCDIKGTPRPGMDIISILDINGPFLYEATEDNFHALQQFLLGIREAGILWITRASQVKCEDPRYSLVLGLARNTLTELDLEFGIFELENFDRESLISIPCVLEEFQLRLREPDVDPTMEWAYSAGKVLTSRFHWINVKEELLDENTGSQSLKLEVEKPGLMDSLIWKGAEPEIVEVDCVEIEVRAVGLNFKDVLVVTGVIIDQQAIGNGLGYESCGIVSRIGANVRSLQVGDRVFCSSNGGAFASRLVLHEDLCVKVPVALSLNDAATMPIVYCTVMYCLEDLARLKAGQSILIQSAAGGVGIAAIYIAQMIGAEIYCTVGSKTKAEYLAKEFGIKPDRIFNSRDASFLPDILNATDQKGVDVVLDSLSGELLHTAWKCVAEFGTMVEIGRRDFAGKGKLAMEMFESNRSFIGFDLMQLVAKRPAMVNSLLSRVSDYFEKGYIKPISPCRIFSTARIGEALRYMQKGDRIGKIVLTMPEAMRDLTVSPRFSKLRLKSDQAYLLVGGLGGLGRTVATWLVEHGARHLVFFSRSAGTLSPTDAFVQELQAMGSVVQTISGDVSKKEDVEAALDLIKIPLAGIMQASMALGDVIFKDMTFTAWQEAILPKVQGTWNLHHATVSRNLPLDFFFLFSSVSSMGRQRGQANYASGNTFLDAFVQYRHRLGLPCSCVNIGMMEDVGYLLEHPEILDMYRATAMHTLQEQQLLDAIHLALMRSYPKHHREEPGINSFVNRSQIGLGLRSTIPLSAANNRTFWKKDPRFLIYRNSRYDTQDALAGPSIARGDEMRQFIRDAKANILVLEAPGAVEFLATSIGKTLLGFMLSDEEPDLQTSITALGLDSLITIELRNWIRQRIGVELSVIEIMGASSILQLGVMAKTRLVQKLSE